MSLSIGLCSTFRQPLTLVACSTDRQNQTEPVINRLPVSTWQWVIMCRCRLSHSWLQTCFSYPYTCVCVRACVRVCVLRWEMCFLGNGSSLGTLMWLPDIIQNNLVVLILSSKALPLPPFEVGNLIIRFLGLSIIDYDTGYYRLHPVVNVRLSAVGWRRGLWHRMHAYRNDWTSGCLVNPSR